MNLHIFINSLTKLLLVTTSVYSGKEIVKSYKDRQNDKLTNNNFKL